MRTTFKLEIVAKSPFDNSIRKYKDNIKMVLKNTNRGHIDFFDFITPTTVSRMLSGSVNRTVLS